MKLIIIVVQCNMLQNVVRHILDYVPLERKTTIPLVLLPILQCLIEVNRTNHFSNTNKLTTRVHLRAKLKRKTRTLGNHWIYPEPLGIQHPASYFHDELERSNLNTREEERGGGHTWWVLVAGEGPVEEDLANCRGAEVLQSGPEQGKGARLPPGSGRRRRWKRQEKFWVGYGGERRWGRWWRWRINPRKGEEEDEARSERGDSRHKTRGQEAAASQEVEGF
ncbi:hypothetical protein U9M48_010555 [Paspalum notatum var. saurae]|uniref:Uncharacterized protein n=1 Tax=Paspalum notatum var. saurae TaxID=547442 RepID=A0AAQ3STG8_PASNO